ncbi:hypothetical protein MD484_g8722, partial [Candolleomyces efflorescens]
MHSSSLTCSLAVATLAFFALCNTSIAVAAPVKDKLIPSDTTAPLPTLLPWTMGGNLGVYAANGDDEAEI